MTTPLKFTTPVGRMIGGSLYTPETTDYEGKPLVIKTGANAGQPAVRYSVGVAFPKTPGVAHWANEPWGAPIWALAHAAFPNGETQRPDFAWKITDGDSTIPNKRGRKPCENTGYAGNWVVWFSSSQAPRACHIAAGGQPEYLMEKDAIKPGYFVQVMCSVVDNKPSASPGLFWNPSIVCRSAYGEEIISGPSLAEANFGAAPLPPGASAVPVGVASLPNVPPSAPGSVSVYPSAPVPVAPAYVAPVNVHPNPAFVQVPPPPGVVVVPSAPPAPAAPGGMPPGRVMTAKAAGMPYAQFKADPAWTDELLVTHGYMA